MVRLRTLPVWLVWALGAIPLALLILDTLTGRLGVDPVRGIEHRLGRTAIYFLIATLSVTPLLQIPRVNLVRFRRHLGLLAFVYAALHLAAWAVFDMGLLWSQALRDIARRPYLTIGMAAFVILAILAATSTNGSIRRLGSGRWKALHRMAYLAVPLGIFHWLLAYKIWPGKPFAVLALFALLMVLRLRPVRGIIRAVQNSSIKTAG